MKIWKIKFTAACLVLLFLSSLIEAQTTAFNYQGRLNDNNNPANGNYEMQFKLFDALTSGNQVGATQTIATVTVNNGIFGVLLDFSANAFTGANRFLEVSVRRNSSESFVTLTPRTQILTAPYSIRSNSAAVSDNAFQLGGIAANQYVTNTTLGINAILNQLTPQTANFNISGSGLFGGSVGIGTTSPLAKLDVRGNLLLDAGANPTLYTSFAGSEQNRFLQLINSPSFSSASGLKTGGLLVSDSYDFANPGKNDLIVKGNVGIGTNAPQSKLSVLTAGHGITQTDGSITVGTFIGSSGGWLGTRSNHPLYFFTNNSLQQMTLLPNGNFGIGTTKPSFTLSVNGDVGMQFCAFCGIAQTTPVCRVNGSGIGGLTSCSTSSLRYKTEVNSYLGGLNIIRALRPITFRWKADGKLDFGLAAEEVASIEPLLSVLGENGEIDGVRYERLNIILINAVKEQQTQIERQSEIIKRQQKQIEALIKLNCSQNPNAEICREEK